jgi:hypothetical protein
VRPTTAKRTQEGMLCCQSAPFLSLRPVRTLSFESLPWNACIPLNRSLTVAGNPVTAAPPPAFPPLATTATRPCDSASSSQQEVPESTADQ